MKEGGNVCDHVHAHFKSISHGLQRKALNRSLTFPSKDLMDKYVATLVKFLRFLEKYTAKEFVFRAVEHGIMIEELKQINEQVVAMFDQLDLDTPDSWKAQWGHDVIVLKDVLMASVKDKSTSLRELQDSRALQEARLTLTFELEQQQDEWTRGCIQSMMETIAEATGKTVYELPSWFIASHKLALESKEFARGTFGSVHRGVWGSGKKVVTKRLFIDTMAIDERMQPKVQNELSLLYQVCCTS